MQAIFGGCRCRCRCGNMCFPGICGDCSKEEDCRGWSCPLIFLWFHRQWCRNAETVRRQVHLLFQFTTQRRIMRWTFPSPHFEKGVSLILPIDRFRL
jgi:hypothetical protein